MKKAIIEGGLVHKLVLLLTLCIFSPKVQSKPIHQESNEMTDSSEEWLALPDEWNCVLRGRLRSDVEAIFENASDYYSGWAKVDCSNARHNEVVTLNVTLIYKTDRVIYPEAARVSVQVESGGILVQSPNLNPLYGSFSTKRFKDRYGGQPNGQSLQLQAETEKEELYILSLAVTWSNPVEELDVVFQTGEMTILPGYLTTEDPQLASAE